MMDVVAHPTRHKLDFCQLPVVNPEVIIVASVACLIYT